MNVASATDSSPHICTKSVEALPMARTSFRHSSKAKARSLSSGSSDPEGADATRRRLLPSLTACADAGETADDEAAEAPVEPVHGLILGRVLPKGGREGNGNGKTRRVANATNPVAIIGGAGRGLGAKPQRTRLIISLKSTTASPSSPL